MGFADLVQFVFSRIPVNYIPVFNPPAGPGGTVPGPETLLAFGLGFAAFVLWRAKRGEE